MGGNMVSNERPRIKGTVTSISQFTFACGYTIPLRHIEWAINRKLRYGDQVDFGICDVTVVPQHQHCFKCSCGEEKL